METMHTITCFPAVPSPYDSFGEVHLLDFCPELLLSHAYSRRLLADTQLGVRFFGLW